MPSSCIMVTRLKYLQLFLAFLNILQFNHLNEKPGIHNYMTAHIILIYGSRALFRKPCDIILLRYWPKRPISYLAFPLLHEKQLSVVHNKLSRLLPYATLSRVNATGRVAVLCEVDGVSGGGAPTLLRTSQLPFVGTRLV